MKKYNILALVLVLTALSLTGCRNPGKMEPTTTPTTHMTTEPITMPTTEATQAPTNQTAATEHTNPGTIPGDADTGETHGTDSAGTNTDATTDSGEGRARQMPRNR